VECNLGNAIASLPQSRDQLENRGDKDDEIFQRVWKLVETKAEKVRVGKIKEGRKERKRGEKVRTKRIEKEKEGKNNESKESGRGMGNLEQRRRSNKV